VSVLEQIRAEDTLPRRNGELVFAAPWESRAFGLAVALAEDGSCDWESFRSRLIAEIAAWEAQHRTEGESAAGWSYYERWLAALERLLVESRIVTRAELERAVADAAHAQAHEHHHEHEHGHRK
jgi:nitrile hydratase accessory protein